MRQFIFLACFSVMLGACTNGPAPDAVLAAECQTYATTLRSLTLVKSELSAEQISTVDAVKAVNGPLCREAAQAGITGMEFDYVAATTIVLRSTRQLSAIQGSVQ